MNYQITPDDQLIINRIDKAIGRLRNSNYFAAGLSIENLTKKRELVITGEYIISEVNNDCLRAVGKLICENVKWRGWIGINKVELERERLAVLKANREEVI